MNDAFADLKPFTEELHNNSQYLVVQLYGGMAYNETKQSPYVVSAMTGKALVMNGTQKFEAQTYSNKTVFLDWFHENATKVWADGLLDMWEQLVPYDGIWLDMNSPTIFCNGGRPLCANDPKPEFIKRRLVADDASTDWYTSYGSDDMSEASTYKLPFIPQKENLDHYTIALNATH